MVDDFVVRRADGVPSYQVAVVVDDADAGIDEVVRGDDLLDTTPRQVWLARHLGLPVPAYAHVPLVVGPDGERLAKRHGAVTLADLAERGAGAAAVVAALAGSLVPAVDRTAGEGGPVAVGDLVAEFDGAALPASPWVFDAEALVRASVMGSS